MAATLPVLFSGFGLEGFLGSNSSPLLVLSTSKLHSLARSGGEEENIIQWPVPLSVDKVSMTKVVGGRWSVECAVWSKYSKRLARARTVGAYANFSSRPCSLQR